MFWFCVVLFPQGQVAKAYPVQTEITNPTIAVPEILEHSELQHFLLLFVVLFFLRGEVSEYCSRELLRLYKFLTISVMRPSL